MRSTVRVLSILLSVLFLTVPVRAAGTEIVLDELGIAITVPEGLPIVTRDTPADDPVFASEEFGRLVLMAMEESGIYLEIIHRDVPWEIAVLSVSIGMFEDLEANEETIQMLQGVLVRAMENNGGQLESSQIYDGAEYPFVQIKWYDPSLDQYMQQHFTLLNGKLIGVCLYSYGEPCAKRPEEILLSMTNSVRLTEVTSVPDLTEDWVLIPSSTYTYPETGMTLLVPSGWSEIPLSRERDHVKAKFQWSRDPSRLIVLSVTDLLAEMDLSQKMFHTRSEADASNFSDRDLAEIFDVDVSEISRLMLDGKEWIRIVSPRLAQGAGGEVGVKTTALILYEDGWEYLLYFTGDPSDEQYQDLELMARSISIPRSQEAQKALEDRELMITISGMVFSAALFIGLALLLRWRKKKRGIRCFRCGNTCQLGSVFCSNCGIRLL